MRMGQPVWPSRRHASLSGLGHPAQVRGGMAPRLFNTNHVGLNIRRFGVLGK